MVQMLLGDDMVAQIGKHTLYYNTDSSYNLIAICLRCLETW